MKTRFRLFQLILTAIIVCSISIPAFNQTPSLIVSYSTTFSVSGYQENKLDKKDLLKAYHPKNSQYTNAGQQDSDRAVFPTRGVRSSKVSAPIQKASRSRQTSNKKEHNHTSTRTIGHDMRKEPSL